MPSVTKEDLRNRLRRHEIAPVYLLYGAETFLRDLAAKTICDLSFAPGEVRDFNETEFSLNIDGNLRAALAAAEQLPMMATRRVIRVTDIRVSASGRGDTLREEHETALLSYLERPTDFSTMVFIADELDKRKRVAKLLIEHTASVEFLELKDDELAKWARDKATESGSNIDEGALRLLVSLIGRDTRRLTVEIEKLSTAALPGKAITRDLIESLIIDSREISNFQLTDHLVAGRKREALRVLKKILDDGGEPLALLGLIASNVRRLIMVKEAMREGADQGEIARIAKLRFDDLKHFAATARRADERKLARATRRLAETDLAIKTSVGGSGPAGARLQIEMLVAELASLSE